MAKERIGIMGGSFNPIHERHIEMGLCAKKEFELTKLLFMPTGNPPHKREGLEDAEHRFEMTRLAVQGYPDCMASRMEIDRTGIIYTVDTLAKLQKLHPNAELNFIIGEDTLNDLPNWHKPDKVLKMCRFLVCCRSSVDVRSQPIVEKLEKMGGSFAFLTLPPKNVSSTMVREKLRRGETPSELPLQELEYIRFMGLYGGKPCIDNAQQVYAKLRAMLTPKRLIHSLLVAGTARELARIHGYPEQQAALSGLMHDCAKCLPLAQMQQVARDARLILDKTTMASGNLLHGHAGAVIAQKEFGISDPNILSSIRCHTVGKVGMLPLDMIVFLSDKIEPSRRSYPALEKVRELAKTNLSQAMLYSLQSSLEYVRSKGETPHPQTRQAAEWLMRITTPIEDERKESE